MAREIFLDCSRRDAVRCLEMVQRDVCALRPGASCLVVQSDDPSNLDLVLQWAVEQRFCTTLRRQQNCWAARLYVLPDHFGEVPDCAAQLRRMRRRRSGRSSPQEMVST
ncbi:MAG: hypothetical protein KTR31_19655 [Myxococcales bacterium]|nr:hypothetical protein [Myxococcales bacterium]